MLSITGLTPGGREMRQRWAGGLHHTNPPRYWRTATVPVLRVTARDVFITLALCNKYRVLALLTAATRPAYRRYTATLNTAVHLLELKQWIQEQLGRSCLESEDTTI